MAFESSNSVLTVRSYETQVDDMQGAFIVYKAFKYYLTIQCAYDLIANCFRKFYGYDTVESFIAEITSKQKRRCRLMKSIKNIDLIEGINMAILEDYSAERQNTKMFIQLNGRIPADYSEVKAWIMKEGHK